MAKKTQKTFIGEKEISSLKDKIVTFTDSTTRTLTERNEKYLISNESADATALQQIVINEFSNDIINYLKSVDYTICNEESIQKTQSDILEIIQKHDIEIGNLKEQTSNLEVAVQLIIKKHTQLLSESLKRVMYSLDDTFDKWIAHKMGFDVNGTTAIQMRNIRVSDIILK